MGRRIDEQTGLVRESQRPLAMDSARRDASFEIFRSGRTSSADKCSLCSRETSAPSEFSAVCASTYGSAHIRELRKRMHGGHLFALGRG